jgi:glycosyltransferase involved in cell wall biosynthesis
MKPDKNILFIVHNYNSFQKDQIEAVAEFFENVYVLVRYNPLFRLASLLPLPGSRKFKREYTIDVVNTPSNVKIVETPVWYLPVDFFYQRLGISHFQAVNKAIKTNKLHFDLIHAHFLWSSGYAGIRIKDLYKVPLVVTAHGYDVYTLPFKNEEWSNRINEVIKNTDVITTPSTSNLKTMQKLEGVHKVIVIPNGYTESLFTPKDSKECRKKLNIPPSSKVLVSVGNLEQIKGHEYLIDAVSKIQTRYNELKCYIIGSGSRERRLGEQISASNLMDKVFLIGAVKHNKLSDWLCAADLFVMPSLKESFGVAQLEALACGVPVVATRNGGSEEIITNKQYGILCSPKDGDKLSQAIFEALNIKWDRDTLISHAISFSHEKLKYKFRDIYSSL